MTDPEPPPEARTATPAVAEIDDGAARRRRIVVGGALLVCLVGGVVLKVGVETLTAAGEGVVRLITQPAPARAHKVVVEEPPRPAPPPDALAAVSPVMRGQLIRPEIETPFGFRFALSDAPGAVCASMADKGLANGGWRPLGDGGSFGCMSDLVPVPGSKPTLPAIDPAVAAAEEGAEVDWSPPEPRRSTLFFDARGASATRIDTLRFKLNLDDPSVDAAGRTLLIQRLADLAEPMAWSLPAAAVEAIVRHRKLRLDHRGVQIDIHPETGPPETGRVKRVNVVLVLATPASRLPADRFVKAPPMPPEMLPAEPDVVAAAPAPAIDAAPEPVSLPGSRRGGE